MTPRRTFLRQSALAAAGLALAPAGLAAPTVLTPRRVPPRTDAGTLVFRPQTGVGSTGGSACETC